MLGRQSAQQSHREEDGAPLLAELSHRFDALFRPRSIPVSWMAHHADNLRQLVVDIILLAILPLTQLPRNPVLDRHLRCQSVHRCC